MKLIGINYKNIKKLESTENNLTFNICNVKRIHFIPNQKVGEFVTLRALCSPETFDFIYPSMRHGKEE